jgi:serine/threonine-protein kinase RsbW
MIFRGELRVEAVLENLRTISHFINGIGQRLRLTEETLFDIDLAVQEAAANIVNHAYPPGQSGEILLRVETTDDVVRITLTDWGLSLDPDEVKPFDIHAPLETRIKSGLGLHLIHSLIDTVVRKMAPSPGGPNELTLSKHIERLQPRGLSPQHPAETERCADRQPGYGDQN